MARDLGWRSGGNRETTEVCNGPFNKSLRRISRPPKKHMSHADTKVDLELGMETTSTQTRDMASNYQTKQLIHKDPINTNPGQRLPLIRGDLPTTMGGVTHIVWDSSCQTLLFLSPFLGEKKRGSYPLPRACRRWSGERGQSHTNLEICHLSNSPFCNKSTTTYFGAKKHWVQAY